jgi:hypothetical protein
MPGTTSVTSKVRIVRVSRRTKEILRDSIAAARGGERRGMRGDRCGLG